MEKQFISSGAGAPDQLASPPLRRALFSSPERSAPHRCAIAKQRVDASRAPLSRVPLRVVRAPSRQPLGCPKALCPEGAVCPEALHPALQTGTALLRQRRLPTEPRPATDRLDRTRAAAPADDVFPVACWLGAIRNSGRTPSAVHAAPAARRRQHRQLLQGDTTRNHRDGSWRRPLHRPTRPRDIAQLLPQPSSRLTGRPPAARHVTALDSVRVSQNERFEHVSRSARGRLRAAKVPGRRRQALAIRPPSRASRPLAARTPLSYPCRHLSTEPSRQPPAPRDRAAPRCSTSLRLALSSAGASGFRQRGLAARPRRAAAPPLPLRRRSTMPSQVQVVLQNLAGMCNGEALGRRETARTGSVQQATTTAVLGARGVLAKRAE